MYIAENYEPTAEPTADEGFGSYDGIPVTEEVIVTGEGIAE